MCHHQKGLCPPSYAIQALPQVLRIKRTKAFVQHHDFRILQQRARQKNSSPFLLRKLPARLPDDLVEPSRHSLQQRSQTEFVAQIFGLLEILGGVWVGPSQQEIEAERRGEYMVLVILRSDRDAMAPSRFAKRMPVQSPRQKQTTRWSPQAAEQGDQRGLATAGSRNATLTLADSTTAGF
jgi:hypothetical protein